MEKNDQYKVNVLEKEKDDETVHLKKQYVSVKECLDEEIKILDMKQKNAMRILHMHVEDVKQTEDSSDVDLTNFKKDVNNESFDNNVSEPMMKEKHSSSNSFSYGEPLNEYKKKKKSDEENYTSQMEMANNDEQCTENNTDKTSNLKESNFSENYTEKIREDRKMPQKIKKLLKIIHVLEKKLSERDKEICRLESKLPLPDWGNNKRSFYSDDLMEEDKERIDKSQDDELLFEKTKNMLIIQHYDIDALKEQLEKKNKEMYLLKNENEMKNEILLEAKKDLEKNYLLLTHYKNKVKGYEQKLNAKLYNMKKCLDSDASEFDESGLHPNENILTIRREKKIKLIINNEIKKRDETICELKNIIENVILNNNRDIIKYKQSNLDLLNKLNLNTSLVNSQKIEIENLHLNFKQLEEDLKNKDEEIKKLHETILDIEEENNRLKADVNKLKFDLEIKNVNFINLKKNIKTIQRENSTNLKKQKERFLDVLNKECTKRDATINDKTNEMDKLITDYNQLKSVNEALEKYIEKLNNKLLKKKKIISDFQDTILDYQTKILVYENSNEIQTLKQNEEHLRKKLDEQMYRNEQLVNSSVLLKKSTIENYALKKQVLELTGALYAKEEENKKLKEINSKNRSSFSSDDTYNTRTMLYNNKIPLKPAINLSNSDSVPFSDSVIEKSKYEKYAPHKFIPSKDDPVDLALNDCLHYFKKSKCNHKPLRVQKIETNVFDVNGKKVVIRFLNGELYVENNSHPIKLINYLLQLNYT